MFTSSSCSLDARRLQQVLVPANIPARVTSRGEESFAVASSENSSQFPAGVPRKCTAEDQHIVLLAAYHLVRRRTEAG